MGPSKSLRRPTTASEDSLGGVPFGPATPPGRFEVSQRSPRTAHPADEAVRGADELTVGVDGQRANAGLSRGQDRRAQTEVTDELGAGAVVDDVRLGADGGHGDRDDDCDGNEHACYNALEHGVFLSIGVCSHCGTFSKT